MPEVFGISRTGAFGEKTFKWTISAGLAFLAVAMLIDAPTVSAGIKKGLSISAGVLIPSLFPFMALCGFIASTDFGRILSLPLGWLTEKVFKLPRDMGATVLMSLMGGYPAGARMISESLAHGRINKETAGRMLCFCVNAGPSFLITAVGAGMFLDRTAGFILFGVQAGTTLLTGALFSLGHERPPDSPAREYRMKPGSAFVLSVAGASSSIITLCGFAVFFSGMLEMVSASGFAMWLARLFHADARIVSAMINGLFEVTAGCVAAARAGGIYGFALASAIVSFSGISVIFQVASFFRDNPVSLKPFLLSRVVHMIISPVAAGILYGRLCGAESVWAPSPTPDMAYGNGNLILSACLIGMCTVLVFSAQGTGVLPGRKRLTGRGK